MTSARIPTTIMTLFDDFLLRAALAGLGVAIAAAPLGTMMVWRRMAFFGDATAHAAILGVALALALSVPIFAGTLVVALVMALMVARLMGDRSEEADMVLGVASHSALAFGLLAVFLFEGPRIDLQAYLFGDILVVTKSDLAVIWGGAFLVCGLFAWRWQRLLLATLSPDLAMSSGINPRRESLFLLISLAITVAVAIKIVGALLIGAMLIIPAASARRWASTPEHMVLGAACIGTASTFGGLAVSWQVNTPAGPSIVAIATTAFILSTVFRSKPT